MWKQLVPTHERRAGGREWGLHKFSQDSLFWNESRKHGQLYCFCSKREIVHVVSLFIQFSDRIVTCTSAHLDIDPHRL